MDMHKWLADERLLTHLIGVHIVLGFILFSAILLRNLLKGAAESAARWTGLQWLENFTREATKSLRAVVFWSAISLMALSVLGTVGYHLSGRDARHDLREVVGEVTPGQMLTMGLIVAKLAALAFGVGVTFRLVRRTRIFVETYVHHHLLLLLHPQGSPQAGANILPAPFVPIPLSATPGAPDRRQRLESTVHNWFTLLERYVMAAVLITGLAWAGLIVGLHHMHSAAWLGLRIVTYFTVARLMTLGCRTVLHVFANLGNRYFGTGPFCHYWERFVGLFPFGERCLEAAIWIYAAAQCAEELQFIPFVETNGKHIVECIGIFFCTRVVIELLHVFINEMFGMFDPDRADTPKGATLVPLLESVSRYLIYFGSALMMLRAFGKEDIVMPILASAGVVGLAVGLGAQSFVSDVVSGFFILFEEQYFVGDMVQISDAQGRVEAINIRHTQIRDETGKLWIIPNGQIKTVVNFSKGYVNAVVDIKVPTTANLDQVMRDMAEAGKRLRDRRREVMADTVVKGLVDLTQSDMTIRAVTKVQPGTHLTMQQEYRRILKDVFDDSARTPARLAA